MSELVDELRAKAAYAKEAGWDGDAHDLTRACDEIQSLVLRLASCELMLTQRNAEAASAGLEAQQLQGRLRTLAIGMVGARMAHVEEDYAEVYHLLYSAAKALSDDPYEPWKALDALAGGAIERRDGQTFVNIPVAEPEADPLTRCPNCTPDDEFHTIECCAPRAKCCEWHRDGGDIDCPCDGARLLSVVEKLEKK